MEPFVIRLNKWEECTNCFRDLGFFRKSYKCSNQDIIIWYQPDEGWFTEDFSIVESPEFSNTPEALMFLVDLVLLDANDEDNVVYQLDEPFIFPDNDL